jgi:type I restriction enzyme S subunit
MSRYKAYPEYKDSGEDWLGEVPSHWNVIKIKHLSPIKRGASPRPIDDAKYFDDDGEYAWTRIADVTASDVYLIEAPQRLSDLGSSLSVKLEPESLFLSIAGTVGKPCITGIKACIHDGFVYFPELRIPNKFLFYVFAGEQAYKGLGKFGTQLNLNTDTVGGIKIGCTDSAGLEKIVAFLDHETAKIDALIEKQQRLIELLKEKRQAVISHAVTKGLNPNAPMKDSGVEWLGDVPAHWAIRKFGFISMVVRGGSPRPAGDPALFNGDYSPWVTVAEITKDDNIYLTETETFLTKKGSEQCRVFSKGTLLLSNSGATLGVPKILSIDANANDGVVGFEDLTLNHEFAYFYLSTLTDDLRERIKQGSGQPNLNTDIVKAITVPVPPDQEVEAIVESIKKSREQFNALVEKAKSGIELLQERRTALISAAVTGKIDVRDWQAAA